MQTTNQYLDNVVEAFKSIDSIHGNQEIECHLDEQKYDIKSCGAMHRISHILTYYISWIHQQESLNEIYEEETEKNESNINMFSVINSGKYLGSYNNTKLLDDFHHIMELHSYQTIQELLVFMDGCCVEPNNLCQLLVRNYRNRNNGYEDIAYRRTLYFGSTDHSTDIATQQILDSIHCFIYHSHDLGHILSAKQASAFNHHSSKYKKQLLEPDLDHESTIVYSRTPKPPKPPPKRDSVYYNQKIDVDQLEMENTIDYSTEYPETDDSLSATPQASPIPYPHHPAPKPSLKPTMDGFPMNSPNGCNDHELMQKIKLTNSKIVIMKQIIAANYKQNIHKMLCKNQSKSNKYIHVLTSYKHLLQEMAPSLDKGDTKDDSSISISSMQKIDFRKKANNKLQLRRHKSETADSLFKNRNIFRKKRRNRNKSHKIIIKQSVSDDRDVVDVIYDRSNAGLTFDFGQRYYYWTCYKDNKWYIESRESSLKMEMLHLDEYNPNQIIPKTAADLTECAMRMEQWNDIEERAHHIHRTLRSKRIICDSALWSREYGIKKEDRIKKEHIIAVLIFCIFDRIRNAFILSFNLFYNTSLLVRERSRTNGVEWMKRNHTYFAHLGRLLRETVECFGDRLDETKSFYFGINDAQGLFKKTAHTFKLPLLCSAKMNVVLNYMEMNKMNDGLLIEIKYYQPFMRYFDCSFITEFAAENEVIFCGGISMLKIQSIYNILGINYLYFIRCMNIVQSMLTGKMKTEAITRNDEYIIRYLVQNEFIRSTNNNKANTNGNEMIPHYISMLFHHFCINLDFISINLHRMNDKSNHGYFAIKALFFTSQNNFIKLDVLCSLFPNVPIIEIRGDRSYNIKLDELFFEELLLILQSNLISTKCQLARISIINPNEDALSLESAVSRYQSEFLCRASRLRIEPKTRELVIDRLYVNRRPNQTNQGCLIQ